MKYKCSNCGEEHEGWPALAYASPYHYEGLSNEDKESIATLSSDFCTINHVDQADRFIRAVLTMKVKDSCQGLEYGVWVSLSEKNYKDYIDHYDSEDYQATYFGYLCNNLYGYEKTISIKTNVVLRGKTRPDVIPHDDQMDNKFVQDYYNGISKKVAESRIEKGLGIELYPGKVTSMYRKIFKIFRRDL